MKNAILATVSILMVGLMVLSASVASGDQSLTVNGGAAEAVILKVGQVCTVEVVSDDSNPHYAYLGFDDGIALGSFSHQQALLEAGDLADVTEYNVPAFYGYYVQAAGTSPAPSPGVHFVFQYQAQELGDTDVKLYDATLTSVLDSVHITVVHAEMGTSFTYQGSLNDAGSPADGLYDFVFELYDSPSDGNQLGSTIDIDDLDVIDGQFAIALDFGSDAFDGSAVWLETTVAHGDGSDPNTLVPRQEIRPVPYSLQTRGIFVDNAGNVGIGTTTPDAKLSVNGTIKALMLSGQHPQGPAVIGRADNPALLFLNFGGMFSAAGQFGRGIVGTASNTNPLPYGSPPGAWLGQYGGYFEAKAPAGCGVYGLASNTSPDPFHPALIQYGGHFVAKAPAGRGVYGWASGTTGIGVYGTASAGGDNVRNYGGYFLASGAKGRAVYGRATATGYGVSNYGGYFSAGGEDGTGIYATASDRGVEGFASGSDGEGVCGRASGSSGRGVYGYAYNTGDVTNYGGYFQANGSTGRGVYGYAIFGSGYGVYGESRGSTGVGVVGWGRAYDFYAGGPGTNYGAASSIRWKSDVRVIDDALSKVMKLRGIYFNWDAEHGGGHDVGMIAEEVGEVLPEIVEYEENGIDASGMDYGMLAPLLVEAVKALKIEVNELQRQNTEKDGVIDTLKQQNDKLEGRLAALESSIATIVVQLKGGGK